MLDPSLATADLSAEPPAARSHAFVALLLRLAGRFINLPLAQLDTAIAQALADTGAFVGADRAYLFQYDFAAGLARNSHEWCATGVASQIEDLQAVPLDAVPDWVNPHLRGQAVHVPDVLAMPASALRDILEAQGIRTTIALPMLAQGQEQTSGDAAEGGDSHSAQAGQRRVQGFVGFDFVGHRRDLGREEVELLTLFAQMLVNVGERVQAQEALALANSQLEERVAQRTQELVQAKARAESADRAKSALMARVSHELRTPLNAVLGFAQLLALDESLSLPASAQAQLDQIRRAGAHLLSMVDDVLDLAKAESGRLALALEPVDLGATALEILAMTQPFAQRHGVGLVAVPGAAVWARADRTRLHQVLMNLVSNAIKYGQAQGQVWLSCEQGDGVCCLSVTDNGVGLDAAQQAALFQAFNRLGAEKREIQGTGLGLAISRELVRAMGGELRVRSVLGQGSRFSVELPSCAPPPSRFETPSADPAALLPNLAASGIQGASLLASAGAQASLAGTLPPMTVLYVEDNPVNVMLMQAMLARPQSQHLSLHVCTDGAQGLEAAQRLQPDVILLDLCMPGMDGSEVLRHLRADPALARTPCVAVSANAMAEDMAATLTEGFDGYLTKPFSLRALLAALLAHAPEPRRA